MPRISIRAERATVYLKPPRILATRFDATYTAEDASFLITGDALFCEQNRCRFSSAILYPCLHSQDTLQLFARHITASQNGVIRLSRPSLKLHHTTILRLPKFTLLPSTHAGMLAPKLEYRPDAGLNVGPRLYIPLGDKQFAVTHAAVRSKGGFDSSLVYESRAAQIRIEQAYIEKQNMLRTRAILHPTLHHGQWASEIDLATHRKVITDSTFDAPHRALTHTESRYRFGMENTHWTVEQFALLSQSFFTESPYALISYTGQLGANVTFAPLLRVSDSLQPTLYAAVDKFFSVPGDTEVDRSRFTLLPTIEITRTPGIFSTRLAAGAIAQKWQPDAATHGNYFAHPGFSAYLSLPLQKRYPGFVHMIDSHVQLLSSPWSVGSQPVSQLDDLDTHTTGHQLQFAMDHRFGKSMADPIISISPVYTLQMPNISDLNPTQIVSLHAVVNAVPFRFSAFGGYNPMKRQISEGQIVFDVQPGFGHGSSTGFYYYDAASPGYYSVFPTPDSLWPHRALFMKRQYMIAREQVSIKLSSRLLLQTGIQLQLYPGIALSNLFYQLEVSTPCKCLTARFSASHVPYSAAPLVMIQLEYSPH